VRRIYILCEGQTEESFINTVLYEYFLGFGIVVVPIIVTTSKTIAGKSKGGFSSYRKFKKELSVTCKGHKNELVTTMIDYYALPEDFPEYDYSDKDIYKKISAIERAVEKDIGVKNLSVYISLHEFETLLYSDPNAFIHLDKDINKEIDDVVQEFGNVEFINKSPTTAPSKRIKTFYDGYSKVSDGTKLAIKIGIRKMMQKCRHFKEWIDKLKSI